MNRSASRAEHQSRYFARRTRSPSGPPRSPPAPRSSMTSLPDTVSLAGPTGHSGATRTGTSPARLAQDVKSLAIPASRKSLPRPALPRAPPSQPQYAATLPPFRPHHSAASSPSSHTTHRLRRRRPHLSLHRYALRQLIDDRVPRHHVQQQPRKPFRGLPLHFLPGRRHGLRQLNAQVNGTRLPHAHRLDAPENNF